jgi:hypothetical protein
MKSRLVAPGSMVAIVFLPAVAQAQYHGSVTFENSARQTTLVKLVGPYGRTVWVPRGSSRHEVAVSPGRRPHPCSIRLQGGTPGFNKGDRSTSRKSAINTPSFQSRSTRWGYADDSYAMR